MLSSLKDTETQTFQQQLAEDWKLHTKEPNTVRERLSARLATSMNDDCIVELAALGAHLYGEHLGEPTSGLSFLNALRANRSSVSATASQRLARQEALLLRVVDASSDIDAFNAEDQLYILTLAVPAITLQCSYEEGLVAFENASRFLSTIDTVEARRLFAVMTANLVCDLLERYHLSAAGQKLITLAAEKSFILWSRDGDTSDQQKASFRLLSAYQACQKPDGFGSGRYPRYLWIEP